MSPFNLADLFSPRIWSSFFVKDPLKKKGKCRIFHQQKPPPWLLLTADQWMPATTDRHRITVAWNVRFDNTCQPLSAPFTWPAFFWRCSGLILKDCRPSVKHGNTNVLIGVNTHKHVMPHASLKEQYNTNLGKTLFWNLVFCPIDRSQPLFYFVPQEKNITVKLARLLPMTHY